MHITEIDYRASGNIAVLFHVASRSIERGTRGKELGRAAQRRLDEPKLVLETGSSGWAIERDAEREHCVRSLRILV